MAEGRADYTPVFLSELPRLIAKCIVQIGVALIQVTPPNEHGFCSLGVSVEITKTAAEKAISLNNIDYWEDLLRRARKNKLTLKEVLNIPFMKRVSQKYSFKLLYARIYKASKGNRI